MFINSSFFKGKIYKLKAALVLISLIFVTGAHGNQIIENDLEDLNILISQFVGGAPNVLTILDLSGSMARNFAQMQIGNWDDSVIQDCERSFGTGSGPDRTRSAHCAENVANLSVCGSVNCENGTCDLQAEFDNQVTCVRARAPGFNMAPVFDHICGNNNGVFTETSADCNNNDERARAAAAIEAGAGLTTCSGASKCKLGSDQNPSCDLLTDYTSFKLCMQTSQAIAVNRAANCTGGTPTCNGQPQFGSSRIDMALDVFFSFLDADDSLAVKNCDDPSRLFDRVNASISCQDYMETPFRDVSVHVRGTGSGFRLPITGAADTPLIDELTNQDANILGVRFRPMSYSGLGNWSTCTSNSTFQVGSINPTPSPNPSPAPGGFRGGSKADLDRIWQFYRGARSEGGTPLAYSLGFDDSNASGSTIPNDALGAYRVELQTDPAIACRPEFVIVITDGEDTCSGECSVTSGSCTGNSTTNANRRSSIQAVSNVRTYNVRNPVSNQGQQYKKEIITFVIGIGINDPTARRTLNAMALAGGTHTTGVIQHTDPNGNLIGTVDIDTVLPSGSAFDGFKALGTAQLLDSSPANATLSSCLVPFEDAANTAPNTGLHCHLGPGQQYDLFFNAFFNIGDPFTTAGTELDGFAFFADNADQLAAALNTILQFIQSFTSTGVSPAAPQSSTSVALRDRIFLSLFTPITTERLWQGRLALFGFVDDPGNQGAKVIVRKPNPGEDLTDPLVVQSLSIFAPNGSLDADATQFHWEAGKILAEIDVNNLSTQRRLFTVDPNPIPTPDPGGQIRYTGNRVGFDPTNLTPVDLGITNLDVTAPLPSFCTAAPPNGITNCSSSCTVITSSACRTCVKNCIRDKVVDLMRGNTGILPVGDPMGTFGINCPDPGTGTGNLDACAVRLGAVLNSTPRVVGSPSPLFFDVGFQNFGAEFRDRSAAVYIGANDGFIHSFHAGELVQTSLPQINPFTNRSESVPFFDTGTGAELFGFATPSFLPASLDPNTLPAGIPSALAPPDFRFGDFKSFVLTSLQPSRSFSDGTPLIADVWIDSDAGGTNGMQSSSTCSSTITTPNGTIDACGKEWHTVLIQSPRNGGGAYTALDVTNPQCVVGPDPNGNNTCTSVTKHVNNSNAPDYPKHMWTIFDPHFGNSWSEPTIGRIRMKLLGTGKIVDRWVMFIGGGLDPIDTDPRNGVRFGNAFYVVDIPTGKTIFKFHPSVSGLANVGNMVCDMPAKVGAFDLNADGYTDLVYTGDTCGRLWRFDVSMPMETSDAIGQTGPGGTATFSAPNWSGGIAFCATANLSQCTNPSLIPVNNSTGQSERQPIFFAPAAVLDALGRRHVIFATGNRRFPSNVLEYGKLYSFIDSYIPAFLAGGTPVQPPITQKKTEGDFSTGEIIDLVPQTGIVDQFTTSGGTTVGNQGEFIVNFPNNVQSPSGEKAFGSPVVISGALIFTTFAPDPGLAADPCSSATGEGRVFALNYLTGQPDLGRVPGAQNLLQGTQAEKLVAAGKTVAQGMPTPAQLTYGGRGSVVMTLAFSGSPAAGGAQFLVLELPPLATRTQTLFWEEIL